MRKRVFCRPQDIVNDKGLLPAPAVGKGNSGEGGAEDERTGARDGHGHMALLQVLQVSVAEKGVPDGVGEQAVVVVRRHCGEGAVCVGDPGMSLR